MYYVNLNKKIEEIKSLNDGREFYYATNKKDKRAEIWEVRDSVIGRPSHYKIIDAEKYQYKWLFDTLQSIIEFHK